MRGQSGIPRWALMWVIAGVGCAPTEPEGALVSTSERVPRAAALATSEAAPTVTATASPGSMRDGCRGEGLGAALFGAAMANNANVRLVLADVDAEGERFSIAPPATERRYEGRRLRVHLREQVSELRDALPSTLEVNVHERSYHLTELIGVGRVASPSGHHDLAVGQRLLLTLMPDVIDRERWRVLAAVPVDPSTDALREGAYGVPAGGLVADALRGMRGAQRVTAPTSRAGGAP